MHTVCVWKHNLAGRPARMLFQRITDSRSTEKGMVHDIVAIKSMCQSDENYLVKPNGGTDTAIDLMGDNAVQIATRLH